MKTLGISGVVVLYAFLVLSSTAAWVTHVVATVSAGAWLLLIIGTLVAPIGVIHGWMVWFGAAWVGAW